MPESAAVARDAAEREVAEETGVSAEFRAVLAIRQSHGFLHGKSDLFFGAALECVRPPRRHHDTAWARSLAETRDTPWRLLKQQ